MPPSPLPAMLALSLRDLTGAESAWADRYGGDEVAALRAALAAVDAGLDPALPGHLLVSL